MGAAALVQRSVAACLVVLMTVTAGCTDAGPDHEDPSHLVVGYRDAAQRLAALDQAEAADQLRDWARLGLASSLGLDRDRLVDAFYDTTPLRDPAFAELVHQPIGPGRGLFDGETLHVLVEEDDPHASRSTGLVLDQHRADAGADPAQVRLHRYQVDQERQRIELFPEPSAATSDVRRDHGWREARVDQAEGLSGFLADIDHLSRVETRDAEIWAGGWRWEGTPDARVTADDVAVLQRGYDQDTGPLPGFSLDPAPAAGVDDLRAILPGVAPGIIEAIGSGTWAGTGYASASDLADAVKKRLFQPQPRGAAPGIDVDRTQLWALLNALTSQPLFSQARYDGGLAGTEVGMTLFYTDLTAKLWVTGVGSGVPSSEVPGFVPGPQSATPPNLCPRESNGESGRLWYGQNDAAFAFSETGVAIGAQATRLFARSDGADGTKVESSYGFGRGLRFWDRHYLRIADYEVQYHRLEQLMRWSGAIEWLTAEGGPGARLPMPPAAATAPDLRFTDWYARHPELRERAPLALVTPPSAQGEAVLPIPSESTTDCGLLRIHGGVALANGLSRAKGTPSGTEALPPGTRRAGPIDPSTAKVDAGAQRFDRVVRGDGGEIAERVAVDLRRGPDSASSRIVGGHREAIPFADAPLRNPGGERVFRTEIRSDGPDRVAIDVAYQNASAGTVVVREVPISGSSHRQTDITARPGQLDRLAESVKLVGEDPAHGLDNAPGLRYRYEGPDGQTVYRFDNAWIEVGTGATTSHVLTISEVVTPGGRVEVRLVAPTRLTGTDIAALRVKKEGVVRGGDLHAELPAGAAVYRADTQSVVGPEQPGAPPEAIPVDARVKFIVASTTGKPSPPGSVPAKSTWRLTDVGRLTGGLTGSRPAGSASDDSDGSGGVVGGLIGSDLRGPGGWIVLVTVCSQQSQPSTQPSVQPENEVCP